MTSHRSTDQLLRRLADATKEHAIILLDPDGNVRWCNRAAEELFGASNERMAGAHLATLFTEDDKVRDQPGLELEIARTDGGADDDRWLVRPDESQFWATGATTCLRDDEGNVLGFGKILRNRTDVREQIETLQNAVDEMRRREARRNAFLSTLAHELRNPLTPLTNASNLLRMLPAGSGDLPPCLDIIDRQVAMLSRLVNDLMDVARIGAGKVTLQLRPADLRTVLRQSIDAMASLIGSHGHQLETFVPPVPIPILADDDRLQQVFTNLIGNAAKYTGNGGHIWVKATIEGNEAVVRFEDDGIGIAPDILPRIFDLFTQADTTTSRTEGGLGIGLSVVKDLVQLHNGSVQAVSDGLGKGSEFTVRLPLRGG